MVSISKFIMGRSILLEGETVITYGAAIDDVRALSNTSILIMDDLIRKTFPSTRSFTVPKQRKE